MANERTWTLEELADQLALAERDLRACAVKYGIEASSEGRYDLEARKLFELVAIFASSPYLTPVNAGHFIDLARQDDGNIDLLPREAMDLLLRAIDIVREVRGARRQTQEEAGSRPRRSLLDKVRERFSSNHPPLDSH